MSSGVAERARRDARALVAACAATRLQRATLLAIFGASVLSFWFMCRVPLSGDEGGYAQSAEALASALILLLQGDGSALAASFDLVRGPGWFMPGMPLLLAPVSLVFGGDAPGWAYRLAALGVNAALLAAICTQLSRHHSRFAAPVFLALPLLCPLSLFLLSTLWADSIAVHLAILLALRLDRWMRTCGEVAAWPTGVMLAALIYLRSNYWPLLFVVLAAAIVKAARRPAPAWRARLRPLRSALAVCAITLALVLPWSAFVSARYGPTFTITTLPLSRIVLLGSQEYADMLREEWTGRNVFYALYFRIDERAKESGRTFNEQAAIEVDLATADVTWREKVRRVGANIQRFYNRPQEFVRRFLKARCRGESCDRDLVAFVDRLTGLVYGAALFAGIALFVLPFGAGPGSYIPAFLAKALLFLVCLHPFFAAAHGRYSGQLLPLVALPLALVLTGGARPLSFSRERAWHDALLGAGQALAVAFAATTWLVWTMR